MKPQDRVGPEGCNVMSKTAEGVVVIVIFIAPLSSNLTNDKGLAVVQKWPNFANT